MQQSVMQFRIDQQTITAENQLITFDLPRQLDYETFTLTLNVALNITTTYTALKSQGVYGFVRRVELLANGQTVLEQCGGFELAYAANLIRSNPGSLWTGANTGFITNPAITGVTSFGLSIPIDRAMMDMVRPKDTNLVSRDLSTLQMRVTLGSLTDIFTGAGVATVTAATSFARLDASAIQEYPSQDGKITTPPFLLKRIQQDIPINATNPNLQVRMPVGNYLRRVHFIQRTSGDLTSALINNIQLVRGTDVRINQPYLTLARMVNAQSGGSGFINATAGFAAASIDFARRGHRLGKVTDCWNLAGAADVNAVFDVTASGTSPTISMVTEELIPRLVKA